MDNNPVKKVREARMLEVRKLLLEIADSCETSADFEETNQSFFTSTPERLRESSLKIREIRNKLGKLDL